MDTYNNISWPGWEIRKRIGSGSFGTVYEIERDLFGDIEKAALKVITIPHNEDEVDYLRCSGLDDASITQTFHRQVADIAKEYKLMAQLRENPNIVRCDDFRDIQHEDGLGWDIYIKMELLTPLMKGLDRVKTEEEIVCMGKDLCNALVECQKRNIIHRDIKPQNVFISESGRFKLGDFGIARTIERTTHATAGIGTYSYMAPEVERDAPYGKTADIYSLGLLMYWLLNERRGPFMPLPPEVPKYGDEERARKKRFSGEAIPCPKNGSKQLKEIVLRACAFEPQNRYADAEEMLAVLKALPGKHEEILTVEKPVSEVETVLEEDATVGPGWDKKYNNPVKESAKTSDNKRIVDAVFTRGQVQAETEKIPVVVERKAYVSGNYVPGRVYRTGDEVFYKGDRYVCVAKEGVLCVWNPEQHPPYWSRIAGEETPEEEEMTVGPMWTQKERSTPVRTKKKTDTSVSARIIPSGWVSCPVCGSRQSSQSRFCQQCGNKLKKSLEEESWKKAEAAHREWLKTQTTVTDPADEEYKQEGLFSKISNWLETNVYVEEPDNRPENDNENPEDAWKRSEAAHRAWVRSQEKN